MALKELNVHSPGPYKNELKRKSDLFITGTQPMKEAGRAGLVATVGLRWKEIEMRLCKCT